MNKEQYYLLSGQIMDACISVHKEIGPGLLESVYEFALLKEFEIRKIKARSQVTLPLFYKGYDVGKVFCIDILVEDEIILELKSSENHHPVYEAQLISYLRLANKKLGFLINFNVPLMKNGIKRFVNNF
ncbi:GxxExxY protein [Solitalea longa]|uniref:GxxExxY protein n=1 Tax=Solitalea longa TaxID=2079460 RepID=A0A2S5A7C0_9SPHI|nr:GxxExxY protein [Solitalea longa]POY38488.1 GxxExxY protein [Solitalea longa]